MEKQAVLDKRNFSYNGDFVRCCNCEAVMLVDYGEDRCPCCSTNGVLSWVDDNNQEIGESFFDNNDEYILVEDYS